MKYDKIILGAGLYGLYSAIFSAKRGESVLLLEYEHAAFTRATYVNQARVHKGYHYPRSFSTAIKSANYFDRFVQDYGFSILFDFRKIYGISATHSWTNAQQFKRFCDRANIRCEQADADLYFRHGMCEGAFDTQEFTYDAHILRDYLLAEAQTFSNLEICYDARIQNIFCDKNNKRYRLSLLNGAVCETPFLLNATYASVNQILAMMGFEPFRIKYELCEIILCRVSSRLLNVGVTLMDGPFFSLMPFGKTGLHSLTSVSFTPHVTSYSALPAFNCQQNEAVSCSPQQLGNCNTCLGKPQTAWPYMSTLAKKYMHPEIEIEYVDSLFSIKPILMASEIDDSRPTIIRRFSEAPTFISVLSGKINTIYDLEEVL